MISRWGLEQVFTYHAPNQQQVDAMIALRDKAKELAILIFENVPDCADKATAYRKLRECIMTANAAIVIPRE